MNSSVKTIEDQHMDYEKVIDCNGGKSYFDMIAARYPSGQVHPKVIV